MGTVSKVTISQVRTISISQKKFKQPVRNYVIVFGFNKPGLFFSNKGQTKLK